MKSSNNKEWLDRRARKYQSKKYHRVKKISLFKEKGEENDYKIPAIPGKTKIVPTTFSFTSNTEETTAFFSDMLQDILSSGSKHSIFIDSSNVEVVTVDALIYLIAIIRNVKSAKKKIDSFKGNLPQNITARKTYEECGFLSYVNSKDVKIETDTEKVQIQTGQRNDPLLSKQMCEFVMEKEEKTRTEVNALQKMLVEMMSNVYYHAYNGNSIMDKNWYAYAEHVDDAVKIVFVDTGAGIPKTVRTNFVEKLQRLAKTAASDAELIGSTLEGDFRTETLERHRGNGLAGFKKLIEDNGYKNFIVISGAGCCSIDTSGRIEWRSLSKAINGTVYCFDIC